MRVALNRLMVCLALSLLSITMLADNATILADNATVLTNSPPAWQTDGGALFKAGFLAGEWQPYVLRSTDFTMKGADTTFLQRLTMSADVVVTDSTAAHYVLTWRFHGAVIETDSRLLKAVVSKAQPVTVTCLVSPVGVLREFLNWSSITTCLDEALKAELPAYALRSDSAAKREIERLYAFRSGLEGLLLRSIRLFHQLHGYGYDLGSVIDVPSTLALPGMTALVPGTVRKRLDSVDDAGTAVVSTVSVPDKTYLKDVLDRSAPTKEQSAALLSTKMTGSTVFDLNTGWVFYTFEALEQTIDGLQTGQRLELAHSSTYNTFYYEYDH